MKRQISLRKALAVGLLAAFACSMVTGLAVYRAVHPDGQLGELYDAVKEVNTGYECGIGIENYNDIKENDVIECFMMEEVEQ